MIPFFADKKVLITGHTGFKGSWLADILTKAGADVTGVSLDPPTTPNLFKELHLEKSLRHYVRDIRNYEAVQTIFQKEKPEIIFHLAAQPLVRDSYDKPLETFATNVQGTANILEAMRWSSSVRAGVIITTDKVYANKEQERPYNEEDALGGHDPYSSSKAAADIVAQSYIKSFFNTTPLVAIARAGNVIGGGDFANDRLVPDIIRALYEKNSTISLRNPTAIRPWQHVLEPLTGYLLLAKKLYEGDTNCVGAWNFGPEEEGLLTVAEMAKKLLTLHGRGRYKIHADHSKHEGTILKLDITKAKTILGWSPKLFIEKSLKLTLEWYATYYKNPATIAECTRRQCALFFEGTL